MPVSPTYPGVYIEEVSSGVRTIVGVATSITAFVGRAIRGPVNEAVDINSYADFERIFGGLWLESTLGFAIRDFYLNGGARAIVVRVFAPTFADSTAQQAALTAATAAAKTQADSVASAAGTAAAAAGATAASVSGAAATAAAAVTTPPEGVAAAQAVAKAAADAAAVAGATPAAVATAASGAVAQAVKDAANEAAPVTKAQIAAGGLNLEAAYEGTWGNKLRAVVDTSIASEAATALGLNTADMFNLTVRDMSASGPIEQFRNLTWKPGGARFVTKVLLNESRLVRVLGTAPTATPTANTAAPDGKDPFSKDTWSSPVSTQASDGKLLDQNAFTGQGLESAKKGLFTLEKADLFNILCIPPYKSDGNVDVGLVSTAAGYCEKRRAMLLVDPPANWIDKATAKAEFNDAANDHVGTRSRNAALYFPRLKQPNPLRGNQLEDFVPCGAVAGIYARTDTQRGVWKAPAGLDATLIGVPALSVPLTDAENGELNPLGVNCLRAFPAAGRVVWGSRTLRGNDQLADEWKYVPIRRIALYIEETLFRGTQWVVFEPNDEPLWAQIRLNVGAFMNGLFRQGAFQGQTPKDAYFVKCDKDTNPQPEVDKGIVTIVVGFAPLKPAEFVIVRIQQIAGQIET